MTRDRYQFLTPIVKIGIRQDTESFDCGRPELNRFLKRYAVINQKANTAQTYYG
jgi:hypothetical protein